MRTFFKKDFLVYWRDRKEIIFSLCAPLLLILVLGFALPDWVESAPDQLDLNISLVYADDSEDGLEAFLEQLPTDITEEQQRQLTEGAEGLVSVLMLDELFEEEELKSFIQVQEQSSEAASTSLEEGEVDAIVTIPPGYIESSLTKIMLDQGEGATLQLVAEESSLELDILTEILQQFMNELNRQTSLHQVLSSEAEEASTYHPDVGGIEQVDGVEMVSAFQYFTIAISILFSMFIAITTASKARTEKREQVFHRILITGAHSRDYVLGKVASTFCLALLQLIIVITISTIGFQLFPNTSIQFYSGLIVIIIVFACFTASLASLFTAALFRFTHDEAVIGLSTLLVILFGTFGGSFIPIYVLPNWLQEFGWWTPNGLTLSMLIQWIQTQSFADIWDSLIILFFMSVAVMLISLWMFPKRRGAN